MFFEPNIWTEKWGKVRGTAKHLNRNLTLGELEKKIAQRVNRLEDRFYAISNGMNLVGSWGIDDCECFASRSSDDDDGERTKEKETIIESSSELNWTEQNVKVEDVDVVVWWLFKQVFVPTSSTTNKRYAGI